ncbi:putative bZIP transcription factor [Venturia nashicola]|uniref:Putative bZIP transcription factor n=1 Tax=Venturia nashicola TaxID=86259 RepID=A0A4Z1PBE9_9PEZI|nr:putative bZIP transcription factor [Venturia nashicola]TLD38624.1 putative bZIP transcription factor [Venturia nashicola]
MPPTSLQEDSPTASMPHPATQDFGRSPSLHPDDHYIYPGSSPSGSTSEAEGLSKKTPRPKLHARKSSGTIIVPSHAKVEVDEYDEEYDEGDARTMSPRRSSEEVDRLEQCAKQAMIEQAKQLQASLLSLCERVDSVRAEHKKLEGGNAFLQSYIGELMQTSKITSAGAVKGKGKGRAK